jgi:hypothetical protein
LDVAIKQQIKKMSLKNLYSSACFHVRQMRFMVESLLPNLELAVVANNSSDFALRMDFMASIRRLDCLLVEASFSLAYTSVGQCYFACLSFIIAKFER